MTTTTYYALDYSPLVHGLVLLQTVDQLDPDTEATAIGSYYADINQWARRVVDGLRATAHLCQDTREQPLWIAGDRGQICTYRAGPGAQGGGIQTREQLPDSGLEGRGLGQPNDIRRIAGKLYICGFAGQVYTQNAKGAWVHMDQGLAEPEGKVDSIDLESIDGTGPNDIYTVGSKGLVYHWNGKRWTKVPVLTNVYLAKVRCFAEHNIVIVGEKGVIIESDGTGFKESRIGIAEDASLSDVALYNDKLYVAAGDKLLVKKPNGDWSEVRHGLDKEKTQFIRLAVGEGRLWAMGYKRLNSFDGKKWVAHLDPNNK